jgi:hypothetical protein
MALRFKFVNLELKLFDLKKSKLNESLKDSICPLVECNSFLNLYLKFHNM